MWKYFVLGVLVGWLLEWIIDWFFWRRPPPSRSTATGSDRAQVSQVEAAGHSGGGAGGIGTQDPQDPQDRSGDSGVSAGTPAGRVAGAVATGAAGAVSTSSATLSTKAPIYRQEDLEAIDGIGPKIGAMLRNNGITTFSELADTPLEELVRIVQSTGEPADGAQVEGWSGQARMAAAQDWAGLASAKGREATIAPRGQD